MKPRQTLAFAVLLLCTSFVHAADSMTDAEVINEIKSYLPPGVEANIPPDQARRMLDKMQRMQGMGGMLLRMQAQQPVDPAPAAAQPALSEDELARQIAALPPRPESLRVEDRQDGFTVNGQGYVDPEGAIRNYAIDPVSGLVTYLAETTPDSFLIKTSRAGANAEAVVLGTARRTASGWQVDSRSGKRASGQNLTILSGGYLVARDTAAFLYVPGKGLRSIAVPNGFVATRFQRGDVLGTGYLLLARAESNDKVDGIFSSLKSLGSTLHMTTVDDYQLFNTASGELVPMNISRTGKDVAEYSECRKQNAFVNKCKKVDFRESLYDKGQRNLRHYYWRVAWYHTPQGPILVAQENGLQDITVRDLKSGKKVVAFNRGLGIAGYDTEQLPDGRVRIQAKLGFSTETVEDAVALLNAAPTQPTANNKVPGEATSPAPL